jgi:hypothetical protein
LEESREDTIDENVSCDIEIFELVKEVNKLRHDIDEFRKESGSKKIANSKPGASR